MIIDIGNILKSKLIGLAFVDRIAGVVQTAVETEEEKNKAAVKKFPVACNVNEKDCEAASDRLTDLVPNDSKKSVIYFEDIGGAVFQNQTKRDHNYVATIRLIGWLNLKLLGQDDCSVTSLVVANIIGAFSQQRTFNQTPFTRIKIVANRQLTKDPNIFSKYTYVEHETKYLLYPFDYFAIDFKVEFSINEECMDTFNQGIIDNCKNF